VEPTAWVLTTTGPDGREYLPVERDADGAPVIRVYGQLPPPPGAEAVAEPPA